MRRWFSLFLTLALLLSLLPGTTLAAGEQTPVEDTPEVVEVQPEVPAEVPPELPPEPVVAEENVELLASGNASVNGTISLPNGASVLGDGYLYVYLYTPPVLDEDGQVLAEPVHVKSTRVTLAQGQSSASYTISGVETGEYILRVDSYVNSGSVWGGECYFNADGTPVSNPYAATILNVGSGTSVNLTLPAAPRSISGTLVFDTAPAADTEFRLYCYDDSRSTSYSSTVTLKAGSTAADFSIGVDPGQFPIQISNMETDAYAFYDIYGNATQDYQKRMVVNTLEESVSGVEINCTSLLGNVQSDGVEVTVQLPAPLTEEREYELCLSDAEGYSYSYSTNVKAGASSFTFHPLSADILSADIGEVFRVAYCDVTNCSSYYSPSTGARYAAEDGITTLPSKAKTFTNGVDKEITITEPACYTVAGTLTREGDVLPPQAAYVMASFNDGETYVGRVVFAYGEASAQYTIYVPQSQQGQPFQLTLGKAMGGTGNQVDETTVVTGGNYTLSGNIQADLSLPAQSITIAGTLSLPAGMTAPEDGLVITLGVSENHENIEYAMEYATYYLPEGANSLDYALCAPVSGSTVVFAEISGKVEGFSRQAGGTFSQSQLMAADMAFPEIVTVSGTLSVPENCRDGVALVRLYFSGTLNGSQTYTNLDLAVPAGKVSVPYSFTLPKGMLLTQGQLNVEADTLGILDTSYRYLQNDLKSFSSQYTNLSATLNDNLNVNIPLTQGVFLSGTLSLAEGLSAGKYTGSIELEPVSIGRPADEYFNFTGTSYDYKISLSEDVIGQDYYLSLRVYEGEGVLTSKTYYYVSDGVTTTDRNEATPITMEEGGAVIDLTIPKAKTISGSLAAEDGSQVVWDPEETLWLYLKSDTGNESFNIKPDAQGNWSAAVDPSFTGEFIVYTYIYGDVQTNIFSNRDYYYSTADHAVTTEAEASPLTIGGEDVTGLKLYVETGWLLSGDIKLPEGGYITDGTVNMSVVIKDADGSYTNYRGSGTVGPTGGSYSVAVPKQAAEYQIVLQSVYSPGVSSNIYWGEEQTLSTGSITGDTDGLDFTLVKAGTVITGTAYRPEGVEGYLNLNLCALVKRDYYTWSYNTNASIGYNDDSGNFSIAIPASETATEYQLYYTIYSGDGVVTQKSIYLCADGSLTTDSSLAGTFSLANPPAHEFTLLTALPFAAGKIRCPEGLEQTTTFVVYPQRVSEISTLEFPQGAVEVMVGPGNGQQDEDGWFSTYSLNDPSFTVGTSYRLICYSNDSNTPADTSWYYVKQNGTLTKDMSSADIYTVTDGTVNTVNFTPMLWNSGSEDYLLQSEHGISSIAEPITYTYTFPGAASLEVTFSDRTDVDLTVNGEPWRYQSQAGQTMTVDGDTLTVVMPALDFGSTYRFGFAVETVTPAGVGDVVQTGAAAVYTPSGSSEKAIMDSVKTGEPVRISLVSQDDPYYQYSLTGAIYDADGMLLDIVQVPVIFDGGTCTASLDFEQYGQAVTLKIFLMDKRLSPEMENITFNQQ